MGRTRRLRGQQTHRYLKNIGGEAMAIVMYEPVGEVERLDAREERPLDSLTGKRIGIIFNQHTSALAFWKAFEQEVESRFEPSAMHRVYKENTWAQAPKAKIEELVKETDFALIGVGA
jgi:hypothetical protein